MTAPAVGVDASAACEAWPNRAEDAPALLRPRVERVDPRGRSAWRVRCELDPFNCWARESTKRDASTRLSGDGLRRWLRYAGEAAERAGVVVPASLPPDVGPACVRVDVEPFDPALRFSPHDRGGGWPTCGDPVGGLLGGHAALAALRLRRAGWTDERIADVRRMADRDALDWGRWVDALEQARVDLAAGVGDDEAAALGADDATRGYLRLDEGRSRLLASRVYSPDAREARAAYDPNGWVQLSTCWATRGDE